MWSARSHPPAEEPRIRGVSKHEAPSVAAYPSRQMLRILLRMRRFRRAASRMSRWPWPHSRCQTAQCSSFPRRVAAPEFSLFLSRPPQRGVGGAPTGALCLLSRLRDATGPHPAGRGASHDAGRSPLGAPPWRFSAGGRASISGIASGSVQRAPRSQVVMPGGRCPGQPAHRSETSGDSR